MVDIPVAGLSAIVVADGDPRRREASRTASSGGLEDRASSCYQHEPIGDAIRRAQAVNDAPVVLLDHADNVGSGGSADVMTVLRELIRHGVSDVAVAAVWDPEAVRLMREAGLGATLTLDLGGRTDLPSVGAKPEPLRLTGAVRSLTNGEWVVRGPMYTGATVRTGPTAVFEAEGLTIVVTSVHHEPWDAGIFTENGIDPRRHRFLLLKSRIHYRAGFAPLAKATFTLDGVGVTTSDNSVLRFERLERPIYPLDPGAEWRAG
jgi:microcystin degradation protein MlrC